MKRSAAVICASLLFAACTWAGTQEITIGVDISTTGPAADLGIPNGNAMTLAPKEIAGQKIRYVLLDDASDPSTAVQNVKRMISQDNIDVLLGPSVTPTSLAVIETIATGKVPMISFASSSGLVFPMDAQKKWVFKSVPNADIFCAEVFNSMVKLHVKTMSMIASDDAFGDTWIAIAKSLAKEKGILILSIEKFQRTDTSTTAQALHAMQGNPDAILIACAGTPAATPQIALFERGYKGKIYQSTEANAAFLRVAGVAAEGTLAPTSPILVNDQLPDGFPTKAPANEFLKVYAPLYGYNSGEFAGTAADALKFLELCIPQALKKGKPGTVQFREALEHAHINGVDAVYTMSPTDHAGVGLSSMVLVQVVHGSWKLVDYPEF